MKRNRLLHLLCVACFVVLLTACNKDEKYDGPSPSQVNAMYSAKLSAPDGGNLTLVYSGHPLIGKEVYFEMKDAQRADITLFGILPGETETPLKGILLTPDAAGYSFAGTTTAANGVGFRYKGHIKTGRMELELTDITLPPSLLSEQGDWYIVHSTKNSSAVYNGIGGPGGNSSSLIGMLYSLVGNRLVGNAISSVLDQVTFQADGTITAAFAPLPDSVKIGSLITGNGVTGRPASDWKQSPANMASFFVKNNTDLYILPNIDMIINQIQQNNITKADSPDLMAIILQLYKKLNVWSTSGIRLAVRPGHDTGLLLVLEKEEVQDLFLLIDVVKVLLPAETLAIPLTEVLVDIIPPQYIPIINLFLKGATLGQTLDMLQKELNTIPLEIGLYLNKEQTYN